MIIALVLNADETVVPIVEGTVLRIYDAVKKQIQDYENPAQFLQEGRRGATLSFAEDKGATVFVAPPQTFCELSYEKAVKDGIHFISLERSLSFPELLRLLESGQLNIGDKLSGDEIAPSQIVH
ncbi:hypothetical protein [Lederbergia graminis]|uniref:Uncharacterized protein n=1 Tax=Lederbergia graminis TaxID=735518 RepID=A0ABW0LGI0_9BACI